MTVSAEVIAHSLHPSRTSFIATLRLTLPKYVLTHVLTHKRLAKNTSSARAIPTRTFRRDVLKNPALPEFWGRAGKGMQADGELSPRRCRVTRALWLAAMYFACGIHWAMEKLGTAKEICNRVIEPWAHCVVVVSGDDAAWSNFLALRDHPAADPTTQALAKAVAKALAESTPAPLKTGSWHLPFADVSLGLRDATYQSVARCARTSYAVPGPKSKTSTVVEDMALYLRLSTAGHFSPFEHQAVAVPVTALGHLHFVPGWQCLRASLPGSGTLPSRFRDENGFIRGSPK